MIVSDSHNDLVFVDTLARTGNHTYFLRACIDESRLIATKQYTNRNCSKQVSQSSRHTFYNKRSEIAYQTLEKANRLNERVRQLQRLISKKMGIHAQALAHCIEKNRAQGALSQNQVAGHRNIAELSKVGGYGAVGLATGAAIGASVANRFGRGTVGKGLGATLGAALGAVALGVTADYIDKNGIYIGNHPFDIKNKLKKIAALLS